MKIDLDFTCPLTRSDMEGIATMGHCPQCDLDIPELSNLTHAEAKRVLSAVECAQDMSDNLHFCSAYAQGEDGDVHFVDPNALPEDLPPEVASLFDDRATFLLALSAVAALGFSLNSVLISQVYAPVASGADVFTLDSSGPRFTPAQAERDADALDAGHDAWVTINLANIRADLSSVFSPELTPEDLAESERVRQARIDASIEHARVARAREAHRLRQEERARAISKAKWRHMRGKRVRRTYVDPISGNDK